MFKLTIGNMTVQGDDFATVYRAAISNLTLDDPTVGEIQEWAMAEVQRLRSEARKAYIPDVHGQELVYAEKLRQARAFIESSDAKASDCPSLFGEEAKARGLSAKEMAKLIITKATKWQAASDVIDAAALKAKTAVQDATNVDDIVATLVGLAAEIGG